MLEGGTLLATKKPRISITFDPEIYEQIKNIARQEHKDMSAVGRELVEQALNVELYEKNLDMICTILRGQLRDTLSPYMNRITALESKSCIQSGTAAFLCAEVLSKFVPSGKQEDYVESYEKARRKAVKYSQSPSESE